MPDPLVEALAASRERTFAIVAHLDDAQLERQIDPMMSPLVWDLGHIAAYEDLWLVHRFAGRAAAAPRARRALRRVRDAAGGARRDRAARRGRSRASTSPRCASARWPRSTPAASTPSCTRWSSATSSSTPRRCARRCAWAALLAPGEPGARRPSTAARRRNGSTSPPAPTRSAPPTTASPTTTSAPATASSSAPSGSRARPVTNATWLHFTEGGGYERREWWRDEGWAWKEEYDIAQLSGRRGGAPGRSGRPRLLVRGRRLRPLARGPASD